MTRGKKGASAAIRRAGTAERALAEAKVKYDEERAAWTKEHADLRNEVQRLKNRLVSEVQAMASDAVRAAEAQAVEAIQAERSKWVAKAEEVRTFIDTHKVLMTQEDHIELARLLGVRPFDGLRNVRNRRTRRMTPKVAKATEHILQEIEASGQRNAVPW